MSPESRVLERFVHPLSAALLLALAAPPASPNSFSTEESFESRLAADPASPLDMAVAEAERHLAEQETEAAESDFRAALLEGWLLLGALEMADDRLDRAASAFDMAAVSAVETRRAETSRAVVALRLGDYETAITLLRKVSLQHPGSARLRRLLAQALIANGRPNEAIQELEEARAQVPEDPEVAFALGSGYLRVGKVDAGQRLLEEVATTRPIPQTRVLIGRTYRDFQQWDLARSSLMKALEMDGRVRRAHYYLGTIELLSRGRDGLEAAIPLLQAELGLFPEDPMANLYLGLALAEDRRFEEALEPLELAAAWPPTRLDALRFMGRCHLGADHLEDAEKALREALELAKAQGSPRQLSSTHYQLATVLRRLGRPDLAGPHFEAARASSSDLVEAARDRFERFLEDASGLETGTPASEVEFESPGLSQLPEQVRQGLRKRVEVALARSYFNLGTMMAQASRFERSQELFEMAASIDSEFPNLNRAIGVAAFNAHDFAVAAKHLKAASRLQGGLPELDRMQALAWVNLEEYGRAAELLASDSLRASDPSLEYTYALSLARSGQPERAKEVFDRLVRQYATWPELHVLLGQAYAEQEDFESAVDSLLTALELDAGVAEANFTLGEIYMRQGRLDEAEGALRLELVNRPAAIEVRYLLAVVLDLANRSSEAVEELNVVLASQPGHADARYLLGKIRLAEGASSEAAMHLEAAAILSPEDSNIRYQLAQALQRLGEPERAAEEFEAYRRLKQAEREGES